MLSHPRDFGPDKRSSFSLALQELDEGLDITTFLYRKKVGFIARFLHLVF